MVKEDVESEMLRISETANTLPKLGRVIAMLPDDIPEVGVGKTAKRRTDAKDGMGPLPGKNIHHSMDVLSS